MLRAQWGRGGSESFVLHAIKSNSASLRSLHLCVKPNYPLVSYNPRMRYMAIDLGEKRTGLAIGDDVIRIVTPVGRIEATEERRLDALAAAIAEHEPDALVIGLPINMDNTEGPAAKAVRDFAAKLETQTGLPIHLMDERLTSYQADQMMGPMELTRAGKKQRRDALAAAAILRDFLETHES